MVWQTGKGGRVWRHCWCKNWEADDKFPAPGTKHIRERVVGTDVSICYFPDHERHTIVVLYLNQGEQDTS